MFHFVANLKPYTFHRGRGNDRFDAYLLSIDFADGELGALANDAVNDERILCADNGNVDAILALIDQFEAQAGALGDRRAAEEDGMVVRYARPGMLSAGLRDDIRNLVDAIVATSDERIHQIDVAHKVRAQNALAPSYLIGMEDFVIATMTGLSIEPEYVSLPQSFWQDRIDCALNWAERTRAGEFGDTRACVFAGLHAIDRDSAVLAGQLAGERGVEGIATGMVGALRDRNWVDFRIHDGAIIELPRAVPRPYLRVAEIAAGFHVGHVRATGRRPRFHALGAGSPILLPMLAVLGDGETYTATDSTSPIVDGWSAPTISLYVDDPAPLKYKAHRIAEHWLAEGNGWRCECPYCAGFHAQHPPKVRAAREWWRAAGRPELGSHDLASTQPLSRWLPFLSRHPDDTIRERAALARVGHNHWVIQRLERTAQRHAREGDLLPWVESAMEAYDRSPVSPPWKAAARAAWQVVRAAAEEMQGAEPGGELAPM